MKEGRRAARRTRRKVTMGRREMCPWGRGHWSRQSLEKATRGHWGRADCWSSSDLRRRETVRANQSATLMSHD